MYFVKTYNELLGLVKDVRYKIMLLDFATEDHFRAMLNEQSEFIQPYSLGSVVIAAFATSYARLCLYEKFDMLGENVLYYDTDSVIYVKKKE